MTTSATQMPRSCAHNLTDLQGNFSSPNYPFNYPSHLNCIWSITVTPGSYIYLQFSKFTLEYGGKHCPYDFVEVSDSNYPSSSTQIKRCGYQRSWCVWSKSNLLHVRFVTDSFVSASGFMAHYATYGNPAKPKVIIPLREVRTVSEHYVWCLSEGTPPISISMMKSSTTLASSTEGIVWSKINHDGNYSCNATNEVGTESKTFYVSLIDFRICFNLCHCRSAFFFASQQVANIFYCTGKHSAHILTNIPTTTTELYLGKNKITQLPENVFSGLTHLSELYLMENEITRIPENVFSGLTQLSVLYLDKNKISRLPENVFSGLTGLRSLGLSENEITQLPESAFSGPRGLYYLDLSENEITQLPESDFSGLRGLFYLYLHDNNISQLAENVFSELTHLYELFLHNNKISQLPENVFSGLSRLGWLSGQTHFNAKTPTWLNHKGYTTLITSMTQNIVSVVYSRSTQAYFNARTHTWLNHKGYTTLFTSGSKYCLYCSTQAHFNARTPTWLNQKGYTTFARQRDRQF